MVISVLPESGSADPVAVGLGVGFGVAELDAFGVAVIFGVADGLAVSDGLGVGLLVGTGVAVTFGVAVTLGVADGVSSGCCSSKLY
jgi:hypothetical protein